MLTPFQFHETKITKWKKQTLDLELDVHETYMKLGCNLQ
jgi:hypothetical protein